MDSQEKFIDIAAADALHIGKTMKVSTEIGDILLANVEGKIYAVDDMCTHCLLYTSPSPRDQRGSRMPSSA